jgi:hypothetical protein
MDSIVILGFLYGAICVIAVALLSYRIIKNPNKEVFTYKKVLP